jgi:hypothetical protein
MHTRSIYRNVLPALEALSHPSAGEARPRGAGGAPLDADARARMEEKGADDAGERRPNSASFQHITILLSSK